MYERLEALLNQKGITAYRLCKDTGISRSMMSQWKNGTYTPKIDKIVKIADYFDVPLEYFYDTEDGFSEERLSHYEQIHEVSAGNGRLNESCEYKTNKSDPEYSTVRICGESMYPVLHDGDLVRVHHITDPIPNKIYIVKVNGDESTAKYIEVTDKGIWLRAENKEVFEDRFYSVQEVLTLPVQIIGVAEELVSRKL